MISHYMVVHCHPILNSDCHRKLIWRGQAYEKSGLEQLSEYLDIRGREEGYLLTFDFSKDRKHRSSGWTDYRGKRIFEAIV